MSEAPELKLFAQDLKAEIMNPALPGCQGHIPHSQPVDNLERAKRSVGP